MQFKPTDDLRLRPVGLHLEVDAPNYNRNYLLWTRTAIINVGGMATGRRIRITWSRNNTLDQASFPRRRRHATTASTTRSRARTRARQSSYRQSRRQVARQRSPDARRRRSARRRAMARRPTQDVSETDPGTGTGAGWHAAWHRLAARTSTSARRNNTHAVPRRHAGAHSTGSSARRTST